MADLERLSRALKAAHAAGDTAAAKKLAQAIRAAQATPATPAGDTSMGTAARLGDLDAQISGREGMAGLNRLVSNSFIGDIQRAGREYIANPIRENVFNLPPIDTDQVNRQFEQNALTQADTLRAERDRIAEERNFQNLTTDDINDVPSFVNFVTQKLAQSAPQMAVSAASFNYATYPFMMGNLVETQEDIEGLSQAEKDAAAAKGAVIMTALETLGLSRLLPDGMSSSIIGGIANGAVSEGVTEGLQELVTIGVEHNAGKKFTQEELLSRLKESVAAGAAAGGSIKGAGNTATKTVKIFSSDGSVNNPDNMSAEGAAAAGAFARRLREIAQANNYDLKDVNANSTKGARETVDKAHIQLAEELKKVFKDLGELVTPDKLKTFIETKDQILAQAAYREARNKTKSTVGQQELDAMRRLVGDTAEGQQAINLMLQLNQLTEVHNAGYKGGLSRITDVFNPLDQNINSYDTASRVVTGTLSPLATAAGAVSTGGASLAPQAALFGTGRAVDAMTGRRSTVDRFVRRNEGNSPDLPAPTAPSLVETKRLQEQQAQDETQRNQEQQKQLNLQLAQQDAPATPGSPQFTMEDATGLSRDGVARILRVLKGRNDNPALIRAIQEYEQSVATGGRIEDLSPLIRAVRQFQEQNPDYVPMVRPPNSLSNPMLAAPAAPGQAPNVDTTEANPVQAQTFGPQLTTQENYNRGIEANQAMNRELVEGVTADPELNRVQKGRLITSLDVLANNLGSDPVAAAQEQVQKLEEAGVPQEAIDAYVKPYVDRVTRQQSRPRMAMAPQEDVPAVDPKKPQAPRLAPEQIPTQTRKVYKLMKVQKSRPGEVLPLFAKSGGDKGPASGYTLGEWFGAENQRPKLGNKLLAPRPGIHAVNLPVFDQGKAKVKGEQRVWVEVEIPAVSPETQAESDNSPVLSNGMRTGVQDRLIAPNESYDYKTNPNASNDAGGWPVAGSMKAVRIVPDAEIAQILRDNGLDHQVENSFSDVDEAKAQQLMQPATPVRMAMAPEGEPQPIPRGETTNIQMPNQLGSAFEFAKGSNFSKGRDFKLALQEKALAAQKEEGIDLSTLTDENINRLADYVVADALVALQDNANAIGWYDRTVTDALSTLSEIYPEIQTNPKNKLQFIWALAVTSNGTKVDKNFELAATAYDHLQRTGRFPTNIGIGEAARAINGGLQQYHTMLEKFERKTNSDEGDHQLLADFMNSQVPVKEIEKEYGVKISGEGKNTLVRGASILGPKIGNGFFSNLYGNFDALTMDRWLMRTVGRHRGTLVKLNQPMIKQKTSEIKTMLKDASPETMKGLRRIFKPTGTKIGKNMTNEEVYVLAARIAKESTSADWRTELNGVSEDLRKAGNALAKYRDGQVEAPAGAKERDFIRAVFQQALERLNTEPSVTRASNSGLTMSDLQALLWYPEKRLYDSSKAPEGQESRGYADDEAPDYANAARKLVEARKGSPSGSGLGSPGPDGPGGGGTSSPNARPALAPVQDNVAGVLAQRIAGGSPRRSPVPSTQEVKQAAEPVRQALSVGLPGGEFENGIKDINQVRKLADAIGVVLKMTDDQDLINKVAGYEQGTSGPLGVYNPAAQEAYALNPRQDPSLLVRDISEFQSYIIALHEVAHGVSDMSGDNFYGLFGDYKRPDGKAIANPMTEIPDVVRQGSFDDQVSRMLIMYKDGLHQSTGRAAQAERKKIVTEMRKLQDKGKYDNGSDVRYVGGAQSRDAARRDTPYYKYIRRGPEFAVDPLIFYMHNPKRMKKEFPATAKMIQDFFKNSGKINFYSHPLAMAVAVVLASMLKAEQEEEQKKQMPPGALNQPMMPGALSA